MTVVVLGWDGLDPELIDEYAVDLPGEFQAIETVVNPELGKPHTWELWPSIITGLTPTKHGIHADEYLSGKGFSSRTLDLAARLSDPIVPDSIRWRVGRWLRGRGAGFDFETLDYYRARDIPTVFDNVEGLPIAIPNARSAFDDALGLEVDRGQYLSEYLDRSAETPEPTVPMQVLRSRVEADASSKLGLVSANLDAGFDLIFVWIAYVDTLGHVAPTVDDPDRLMHAAYSFVERQTRLIDSQLGPNDQLLCVSDHGLRNGEHTNRAVVTGPPPAIDGVGSVLDIAGAIESAVTSGGGTGRGYRQSGNIDAVESRLADLGYI